MTTGTRGSLLGVLLFALLCTASATLSAAPFSFEDRVACQTKIEDLRWSHRIWPEANPLPKPQRFEVLSDALIRDGVLDEFGMEAALSTLHGVEISNAMLQAEIDRMARNTKAPDRLQEIFDALGNDPRAIAECLVRPVLAEKILRERYEQHSGDNPVLPAERKQIFDDWWRSSSHAFLAHRTSRAAPTAKPDTLRLPAISGPEPVVLPEEAGAAAADSWQRSYSPTGRTNHTAVWTGSEMIIWGGSNEFNEDVNNGGRYDPVTDRWLPTTLTGAPDARVFHSAVWTGTEMIIWGGRVVTTKVNSGGRYNPITDSWTATSTSGAVPSARVVHSAIWTGTYMIVWGGSDASNTRLNSGGRYHPGTDTWIDTSTVGNVPAGRYYHTAIWTGAEMIVWGGFDSSGKTNTGGRYTPATDTWSTTSTGAGVPTPRYGQAGVWTGSEMIIWGGYDDTYTDTGSRYDPSGDTWTTMGTTGDLPAGRSEHSFAWSGSHLVVWGGYDSTSYTTTGARYDPAGDTWTANTTTGSPTARSNQKTVWTGTEMIIWGGTDGSTDFDTGGRYNPTTDTWTPTSVTGAPTVRQEHTTVWTGNEMIVWGGYYNDSSNDQYDQAGGRYDPATDRWSPTALTDAPVGRYLHTAIWTGTDMIIWGGFGDSDLLNTGGRYSPAMDRWAPTDTTTAPAARFYHSAVWSGSEMIVWGGGQLDGGHIGGRYNPVNDTWLPTAVSGQPETREYHTAVWAGSRMVVWGGRSLAPPYDYPLLDTGGRYDPATNSWSTTSTVNVPTARHRHTAVWTGNEMAIWGGEDSSYFDLDTGGRYDPVGDTWLPTSTANAPSARQFHSAVWDGERMIVWGGGWPGFDTGGRYDPVGNSWVSTSTVAAAEGRHEHTAVWTGNEMIIWGGYPHTPETGLYYPYPLYSVGGTVASLAGGNSAVLQLNGGADLTVDANGGFTFLRGLRDSSSYEVTLLTQPTTPTQLCSVTNESGTISTANVTDVQVTCTSAYTVGGTVSGLETSNSVVLQNNLGDNLTVDADGEFTFATGLPDATPYSVTVLTQPSSPDQTCEVTSGSGTIMSADVTSVVVDCVTDTYSVGGTVSGLESGNGVVLQNNAGDNLTVSANDDFTFATELDDGSTYLVTVLTQPTEPDQTCTVLSGSGTIDGENVTDVSVTCVNDAPPDDLPIDDPTPVTTTVTYEACSTITVDALTIEAPGDVTFKAGSNVVFNDGFSVGDGATFTVVLEAPDGCP